MRVLIFVGTRTALERYDMQGVLVLNAALRSHNIPKFLDNPDCVAVADRSMVHGWRAPEGTITVFDQSWHWAMNDPVTIQAKARARPDPRIGLEKG